MEQISLFLHYFFVYEDDLPDGVGYQLFGTAHILWLLFCGGCIALTVARYRTLALLREHEAESAPERNEKSAGRRRGTPERNERLPMQNRKTIERMLGIAAVCLLVVRMFVLSVLGVMSVYELPLHMCSIAGLLCGFHAFVKWDWLGQVLYTICLPGAVMALLFPNGVYYPPVHFITVQSFLFHAAIVAYVLCQLAGGGIVPRLRGLWKCLLFLLITVPPVYFCNKKYGTNFMFLNRPAMGSPLEWVDFGAGYLLGYGILALGFMALMDIGYCFWRKIKRNGR